MLGLEVWEILHLRLSIQIIALLIALIVARIVVVEWRRNPNSMYRYLALGFTLMLAQIAVMAAVSTYSYLLGNSWEPPFLFIIKNTLLTGAYIYIAAAFITLKNSFRSRFVRSNLLTLFTLAIAVSVTWTVIKLPLKLILLDFIFQIWNTGLLLQTVLAISRSTVRQKKELVAATSFLLAKQAVLFYSMAPGRNVSLFLLLESTLLVVFLFLVVITLHREIVTQLVHADMEKNHVKEKAHQDMIRALINSLEAKDVYTRGHSDRVTEYAMVLGQKLGFDKDELTRLYYGAILHDIGKIGINEEILNNPFSLCRDEFDCMKKHPEIGANIVSSVDSLKSIAPSILYHHERYDGSGYPAGLKGEDIPLHARIISISDALDAMSSKRSYRDSLTEETAIHELITGAGTQFDPELVKIFVDALGIQLNDDELMILTRTA